MPFSRPSLNGPIANGRPKESAFATAAATVSSNDSSLDPAAKGAGQPPRSLTPTLSGSLPPRAPTPKANPMEGTEAITASFNQQAFASSSSVGGNGDLDRVPPPPTPPLALGAEGAVNGGSSSSNDSSAANGAPGAPSAAAAAAAAAATVFRSSAGGVRSTMDASELRFVRSAGAGSFARVSICEYRPGPQAAAAAAAAAAASAAAAAAAEAAAAEVAAAAAALERGGGGGGGSDAGSSEPPSLVGEGSTTSAGGGGLGGSRRASKLRRASADSRGSMDDGAGFVRVAVKALQPHLGAAAAASLRAEGELLSRLSHPNVVGFVAAGDAQPEEGGAPRPFIVQQCVDGGTLKDRVCEQMTRCGRAYGLPAALAWATDVAAGLAYLHSHDPPIAHRDLKLENILLTRVEGASVGGGSGGSNNGDGSVRSTRSNRSLGGSAPIPTALIADFGLAKPLDPSDADGADGEGSGIAEFESKRKTRNLDPTAMTGSFLYMSPETLKGERYDARADIFSLGVLLYELFSGVITSTIVVGPTFSPTAAEEYARKVSQGYRREVSKTVPPAIRALISDCWAQDPAARPTAQQALERLTSAETCEEIELWSRVPGGVAGVQAGCACSVM